MKRLMKTLDEWLRRRIRMCYWKQWKKIKTKYDNLKKLGSYETESMGICKYKKRLLENIQ